MKTFARWLPVLSSCLLFACGSSNSVDPGADPDTGAPTDDTGSGSGDGTTGDTAGGKDTGPATGDTKAGGDTKTGGDTGPVVDTGPGGGDTSVVPDTTTAGGLKTVFIIMMENHSWSSLKGSSKAPYINGTLLPMGGYATNYFTPPGNHPSEPNYIWLEAGDNLGITNDNPPNDSSAGPGNHQSTTEHLVTQLETAGIAWSSYQEDMPSGCPVDASGFYAPKHDPFVFFDDVTSGSRCTDHIKPYTSFAADLAAGTVGRYVFITPNQCNDMHGQTGCPSGNTITAGDDWLKANVPPILASAAYKDNGVLFILWDEGSGVSADGPIGMIALSPKAKPGYSNAIKYDHSSMLRTVEDIFGVPALRGAKTATNLADFFTSFP